MRGETPSNVENDGGTREPTMGLLVSGEFYSGWRQPERQQRSESGADGKDDLSGTTHEEHAPPPIPAKYFFIYIYIILAPW